MMKILLVIVVIIIVAFILLWLNSVRRTGKVLRMLDEKIQPAVKAVNENNPSANLIIYNLAKSVETRSHLFTWLKEQGKEDLFPAEYGTLEKLAESTLARWLMHPNELGAIPDEIELVKDIERKESNSQKTEHYFVFKFRIKSPHWAAKHGWMAGVAGPWVFSELESIESATPEEHLAKLEKIVIGAK